MHATAPLESAIGLPDGPLGACKKDAARKKNRIACRAYDRVGRYFDQSKSPEERMTEEHQERKNALQKEAHAAATLLFNAGQPEMTQEECRRFVA